ncbi:hypothetical protein EMIHUDRAFT_235592 [Emiliania huxleyi CCMP1516]|uniref:JmjC domain-containing protein n=2 Tax=Emiliania huxleyi TaxID=2903 RepID=A0A0D3JVQ3_EMIH1|nr:hypothetical protein EMIHUDRAFT_235592 [Emiliania huxleyi CCMP1516]EOD27588.1 hypothetical protein EMIHUDRAFT_235592 [Emiliania huxleyi CCMP1516]|eukprot:XP_005780017.1 hypothetical protein EMIHUDRAFT_235592 [Emiliania huxleyi CCMP1516]
MNTAEPRQRVPRVAWNDASVTGHLARGEPIVLVGGCPLIAAVVGRWSFDSLSAAFGERDCSVHVSRTENFARLYGHGLGLGGVRQMPFRSFVEAASQRGTGSHETDLNYYLQVPLVSPGAAQSTPVALEAELRDLGWAWLHSACEAAASQPLQALQLWAGHGVGMTPCHFDAMDNFLAQLEGRKSVLVYPPHCSFDLYPYPTGHPADNFAMADPERPDLGRWPGLARATALEAELAPGDVLWLPRYHWHLVRQVPDACGGEHPPPFSPNLSLSAWVGGKGTEAFRAEADAAYAAAKLAEAAEAVVEAEDIEFAAECASHRAAALRAFHAARLVETIAAKLLRSQVEGGAFLTALAAGADASWPAGSSARRAARRIRLQLAHLLGSEANAAALLRATTQHGRLAGAAPPCE